MTTVANLLVQISADTAQLASGLRGADNQIARFSQGIEGIGNRMRSFAGAMGQLTAPLAQIGTTGLNVAADFESAMAEIEARTGSTASEMDTIRQTALQLGADTSFSAQQAADAFLQLLSSGQSTSEALATIRPILDGAAASGEDLGRTADVVTDIMASFGLGVEEAADIVNVLAQGAGASSADMASLGQGFANVGGVARQFGLSVEDTAAVLAIFSENGVKGAEAGTQLKSMLLNMTRPTDTVQGAWNRLGVSFYDAAGNARPLEDVILDLDTALDGLPVNEQNELMQTLAGSYGIMGLSALRGSISIDEMRQRMRGQALAADVARARMNTFKGVMDSLRGSVETLMINALTPFMQNVLTPLASQIIPIVNAISDWAYANPELSSTLAGIIGIAIAAVPVLMGIGTAITLAAPAVGVLAAALALLSSPLALAVGGLILLANALKDRIDFTGLATDIKDGLLGSVSQAIDNLNLSEAGTALADRIAATLRLLKGGNVDIVSAFSWIADAINDYFATGFQVDLSGIRTAFDTAFTSLSGGFSVDTSGVTTAVQSAFSTLDFSGVQSTFETHFDAIVGLIATAASIVFGGPVGLAIGAARLLSNAIASDFLGIGTALEQSGIVQAVQTAISNIKSQIDNIINSVFSGGQQTTAESTGIPALGEAVASASPQATGPLATFVNDLQTGLGVLQDILTNVWSNLEPGFTSLGNGIKGFIDNLAGTETGGLLRVATAIGGFIGLIAGKVLEIGSEIFGTVMEQIGSALPALGTAINNFISAISNIGEGDWGQALTDIGEGLIALGDSALKLVGIDVETVLQEFNRLLVGIRTFGRDVEATILDLQMKAAAAQIVLGINVEANEAFIREASLALQSIDIAGKLETDLNNSLATGEINIDLAQLSYITSGAAEADLGVDALSELASKITDPALIDQAVQQAFATNNTEALTALVPLSLELAEDPAAQLIALTQEAFAAGTLSEAEISAITPIAQELEIDLESLITQFQTTVDAATAAPFDTTVTANITVNPGSINISPAMNAIQTQIQNAAASVSGGGGGGGGMVPALATGGYINSEGLAYLHAGEVVLNRDQQAAFAGGGGRNVTVNVSNYGNTMFEVLEITRKAARREDF